MTGRFGALRMNALQQRETVALLHHDVGQNQFEGVVLDSIKRFTAARSQQHVIALALEGSCDHRPDVRLVVDHQNARHLARLRGSALLRARDLKLRRLERVEFCES